MNLRTTSISTTAGTSPSKTCYKPRTQLLLRLFSNVLASCYARIVSELTPEPAQTPDLKKTAEAQAEPAIESPVTSPIVICVLLAAITLFTFWPVVHFNFVNFDDPDYVGNWHVQKGLTLSGIVWAFGTWHPITWISHMLDAQFFGKDPTGPHLVNLLLHVANSVLLFVV